MTELNRINFAKAPNKVKEDILRLPAEIQDFWVAIWIAQPSVLEDMRWRPFPTKPKKINTEYLNLNHSIRKKMNEEPGLYAAFWKDKEVVEYYEKRQEINSLNWRNLNWLKWAKTVLKDQELIEVIEEKINGFIDIEDHPEPINVKTDTHWSD